MATRKPKTRPAHTSSRHGALIPGHEHLPAFDAVEWLGHAPTSRTEALDAARIYARAHTADGQVTGPLAFAAYQTTAQAAEHLADIRARLQEVHP